MKDCFNVKIINVEDETKAISILKDYRYTFIAKGLYGKFYNDDRDEELVWYHIPAYFIELCEEI